MTDPAPLQPCVDGFPIANAPSDYADDPPIFRCNMSGPMIGQQALGYHPAEVDGACTIRAPSEETSPQ
jgi:hypothetical protein